MKLEILNNPKGLRKLSLEELPKFCQEVRTQMIDILSQVGGHFASNLGIVELTVALHYVYASPKDRIIWDTGHQVYAHKMITGRLKKLYLVRQLDGLSGFPKREESPYDHYNTGHAGTSISQMLGEAIARDRLNKKHHCVAVIGDAAIGSGMAFEALNHGGDIKTDCLVVINDNDMSISKNVGALNQYMNNIILSKTYNRLTNRFYSFLFSLPWIGSSLEAFYKRLLRTIKSFLTAGSFFENLGFRYIGPVDGHDVVSLVKTLQKIKKMNGPLLFHVYTQKGKGYELAEKNPIHYHSIGQLAKKSKSIPIKKVNLSDMVGDTLLHLIKKNRKIVVITPAMIEGSGLRRLAKEKPKHVFDVGIAEQHSMTFAGALASAGLDPFLCIYSTFLNRTLDQLIQDVALMRLPVRLVIDRAGCVGPDGETHQGLYDLGMLLAIPNIAVLAPCNSQEVIESIIYMHEYRQSPIATRFPKQSVNPQEMRPLSKLHTKSIVKKFKDRKKSIIVHGTGKQLAIISIGFMQERAHRLCESLYLEKIKSSIINLLWLRPFDFRILDDLLKPIQAFVFLEDSYIHCSASTYVLHHIKEKYKHLHSFAFPMQVIPQGNREQVQDRYGFDNQLMINLIKSKLRNPKGKV